MARIQDALFDTLYNLDRAAASLLGAPPEETLSSQIGRAASARKWWGLLGARLLNWINPGHTDRAITLANKLGAVDGTKGVG